MLRGSNIHYKYESPKKEERRNRNLKRKSSSFNIYKASVILRQEYEETGG